MTSRLLFAKTALFSAVVPGTVAVAIPRLLARWRPRPRLPLDGRLVDVVGAASILAGIGLYVHTVVRFGRRSGTPSPTDEPEELVTGGAYAHTRNPMYVAVLLVVLGQALRLRSVAVCWWAAGCWIGFHNRVVGVEEPHLAAKHGEAYEAYRERVPRWIPRLRPPR